MATSTGQRVGIWIIAGAMTVGTIAGFLAMIISPQNEAKDQASVKVATEKYQKDYKSFQDKMAKQQADIDKQADALSNTYKSVFVPQLKKATKFDADLVKKVNVEVVKKGSGSTIQDDTTYAAYYVSFNPAGKVFDSSINTNKKSLKSPLIARPNGVIPGWSEAMKGKKIGGIYKLTIPSDKAYGADGKGKDIGPNTPLTFFVMPIEILKTISEPKIPQELIDAYGQQ